MNKQECIAYVESHMQIKYATKNGAYTAKRFITPEGCVNHSVGCAQPNPEVFFNLMNRSSAGWGVMALIGGFDKGEGTIIVTLPYNARCWGCGSGSKGSWNNTKVQWEICEPAGHTYAGGTMINYNIEKNQEFFNRMWKMVVAWNVYICAKFGYPISGISDHSESYYAGYGSGHADVGQWWPKHGKSMDALRAEVQAIMNGGDGGDVGDLYKTPFTCTTTDVLNCRSTSSTSGSIVKTYAKGTKLTITKVNNGWGYTGIGWVSLSYVNQIQYTGEKDVLDMTEQELTALIDKRIAEKNPTYPNITDVPSYWRPAIQALIDMNIINGGTDNKVNAKDVNLTADTVKALIIMKSYIDSLLNSAK